MQQMQRPRDAVLAGVLGCAAVAEVLRDDRNGVATVLLAIVACAALGWRRRAPLATTVVVYAAFVLPLLPTGRPLPALGDGPTSFALMVVFLVATYTAGSHPMVTRAGAGLAAGAATSMVLQFAVDHPEPSTVNDMLAAALFSLAVPWLCGFVVGHQRRLRAAEQQQERTQLAAAEERARIAREVHDIVAHSVSVMVVQAEAGEALLDRSPARAQESLQAVQRAGRDALAELRRTLSALKQGSDNPLGHGLEELEALVSRVRDAGLPVAVLVEGAPGRLPTAIDESAYRLVQEALTNALRHSDRSGVVVRLVYGEASVDVAVVDRGRPVARGYPGGHGLAAMKERVARLGGSLDAGPAADGAHVVHAVLPLTPA